MTKVVHLARGSVFAGEFRVLRPLGEGAMGAVYAVEQWRTGHVRALKLMQPALVDDARARARFLQEATVSARIKSDHVVHVVDAGIDEETNTPWIAMELLEGADLGSVLDERGALPPEEVREILAQLCHAVDAAHDAGVVHRDLKPQNIFLAASRREGAPFTVKVLDFGIAKLVAEAGIASNRGGRFGDQPTALIGTPSWMAPEQTESRGEVTAGTDVWALGLIAFALFTGHSYWRSLPAQDPGGVRLLREVLFEPLPTASRRAAELGCAHLVLPGFDAWFARCVARDVDDRFPGARQARNAFERVIPSDERASIPHWSPPARRDDQPPPAQYGSGQHDTDPAPPPEAPTTPPPPAEPAGPGSLRVLVIDDNRTDQLLIGHHLRQAGYLISSADCGEEGLARADKEAPALILLDFMLPDIDAPAVLRRLRTSIITRDVPVILLTGTDLVSHIAEGFAAGANDYLMKPVDARRLIDRIEAAISARELARRARFSSAIEERHERLVADLEEARAEQEVTLSVLPAAWGSSWAVGGVAQSGLVGGDLIALYEGAAGERTAVVVDVSGHGAGAALGAASVRATLALLLRDHGPAAALSALNDELDNAGSPRHACVAIVQIKGAEATVVNAGLPPVYLARGGRPVLAIASSGVPPGLLPAQPYEATSFAIEPGDRIVVVSDGLVEPFGLADDALAVLADVGVFDRARWTGTERPVEVADRLRHKLAAVAAVQPDDASLLLIQVGA